MRFPIVLVALSGALLPLVATAALTRVADNVFLLPGTFASDSQPDGNSTVFAGPKGLVIVDTGRHVEHAQALLDFAASRGQPIRAVVNSHWHLDHVGGNALLRERVPGLKVIASSAVAPAFSTWLAASRRDMQAELDSGRADAADRKMMRIDIALIDAGSRLVPDVALDGPRTIDDAGRPLQIGYERDAVTGGDLWVFDPATRVLASGDLVTLPVPFLDTACAPRWSAALARLEQVPFETLVPGHGAPMTRADLARYRQDFDALLACAASNAAAATCADGWIAGLGPLLPEAENRRAPGMIGYYLERHLRAAPAQRDRFCPAAPGVAR